MTGLLTRLRVPGRKETPPEGKEQCPMMGTTTYPHKIKLLIGILINSKSGTYLLSGKALIL